MNLKLETEFSKAPILQEVDALKKQIDDMRPLSAELEGRVMQKLRLDWNYNSNAIEGNKLSYGETMALIMHGVTAKGKPLKDHLDIKGHNKAVEYLEMMVKDERDFVESDIRGLHAVILGESYDSPAQTADGLPTLKRIEVGTYKLSANHVKTVTGQIHYYATPEETPAKMTDLMNWYVEAGQSQIHPVVVAALFHHRFVAIHPFDDGNGRMARILMNLILMRNGYPPVVVKKVDKESYYALLSQADAGEDFPFIEYIADGLRSSLDVFFKAINGGDIDEDEDIDKEIALLKMQLKGGAVATQRYSNEKFKEIFENEFFPLAVKIFYKLGNFEEFFFDNNQWMSLYFKVSEKVDYNYQRFNVNFLPNYIKLIEDSGKNFNSVRIEYSFSEYKNPINNFGVKYDLRFDFEDYHYNIINNGKLVLSKLYHENILKNEESKIIKDLVSIFKNQLNEKLKSPESN